MAQAGFECPEGTRIIIQRPDGFLTALVTGTVRIKHVIEKGDIATPENGGFGIPDRVVGASMDLHLTLTEDKDRHDSLYHLELGQYEDRVQS
jgi:hypothetical protein